MEEMDAGCAGCAAAAWSAPAQLMLAYGLARRQYPSGPGLPAVTSGAAVPWPEASIFYIQRKWEWGVRVRSCILHIKRYLY